jgi:hypothetical protein
MIYKDLSLNSVPFGSVDSQAIIAAMDAYCNEIDESTIAVIDNAPIHKR